MLYPLNVLGSTVGLVVDAQSEQIKAFQSQLQLLRPADKIQIYIASELASLDKSSFDKSKIDKWLTLGGNSLNELLANLNMPSAPVLALFLPESSRSNLAVKYQQSFSSLQNAPDVIKQLSLIRTLVPQAKQVGVFYSSHYAVDKAALNAAAKRYQLTLHWAELKNPLDWDRYALKVLGDVDLVLGVNDDAIYNTTTIRSILMRLYRSGKALIGPDKGYVRAGAVASVYSGIEETLKAAADWIQTGTNKQAIIPNPYFNISVNTQVARSLNIVVEDANDLTKQVKENLHAK